MFLGYATWFQSQKKVMANGRLVRRLVAGDGRFVATFDDGTDVSSDIVVAVPGALYFRQVPEWAASAT